MPEMTADIQKWRKKGQEFEVITGYSEFEDTPGHKNTVSKAKPSNKI